MLVVPPAGAPLTAAGEWPAAVITPEAAYVRGPASVSRVSKVGLEYLPLKMGVSMGAQPVRTMAASEN